MSKSLRFAMLAPLVAWVPAEAQEWPDSPDEFLAYFTGTWDVRVTFTLPNGSEGTGSATCVAVSIMDGAFLQQEYQSTFGGQRLAIRQFLDQKRTYVEFQLHEGGGAPTQTRHLEGSFSERGTVLTLAGDSFDSFTGEPVRMRTVTPIVDADHYVVEEWFLAEEESEQLKVVLHHARWRARATG